MAAPLGVLLRLEAVLLQPSLAHVYLCCAASPAGLSNSKRWLTCRCSSLCHVLQTRPQPRRAAAATGYRAASRRTAAGRLGPPAQQWASATGMRRHFHARCCVYAPCVDTAAGQLVHLHKKWWIVSTRQDLLLCYVPQIAVPAILSGSAQCSASKSTTTQARDLPSLCSSCCATCSGLCSAWMLQGAWPSHRLPPSTERSQL